MSEQSVTDRGSGATASAGVDLVANYTSWTIDPRSFAREAEQAGFAGVSCSDHFFRTSAYPHMWVTLAAMAAATERVFLTSSFANNLFRSPVEFAQASLTMQALSDGRFEAGLGAGWLGRQKILVFNHCYHGAVDETYVTIDGGLAHAGPALIGEVRDLTQ